MAAKQKTAVSLDFTGFTTVFLLSNCQRWDCNISFGILANTEKKRPSFPALSPGNNSLFSPSDDTCELLRAPHSHNSHIHSHIAGLPSRFYAHVWASPKVFHPLVSKLPWMQTFVLWYHIKNSFSFLAVKFSTSISLWERKAGSSKYLAPAGHFRTQAWHLMHTPDTVTQSASMEPMGQAPAQIPHLLHFSISVRGFAFRNLAG